MVENVEVRANLPRKLLDQVHANLPINLLRNLLVKLRSLPESRINKIISRMKGGVE